MDYSPPTGSTEPNAPYVGKNTAAGLQGSRVPRLAVEATQREIVATIREALLTPTNTGDDAFVQLLKAIRGGNLATFTASGAANALAIAATTPHKSLFKGLPFRIFPILTNTGSVTLAVNAVPGVAVMRRDGSALLPGDILAGCPFDIAHDGVSGFRMLAPAVAEVPRLVANPTLYVRADGSDNNDGLANSPTRAFKTVAAAVALGSSRFALAGATLTIQLGIPGTYDAPSRLPPTLGTLLIVGDIANQDAYILSGGGPVGGGGGVAFMLGGVFVYRGLTLTNTAVANHTLNASCAAFVTCEYVSFSSTAAGGFSHIQTASSGSVFVGPGCKFLSSMASVAASVGGGSVTFGSNTLIQNNPAFSAGTLYASSCANINVNPGVTISGAATGKRYTVSNNAIIETFGAGANAIPGSVAGTMTNGGIYE